MKEPVLILEDILASKDASIVQRGPMKPWREGVFEVSTDTRTMSFGSLFLALTGPKFDGHVFVVQAVLDRGAPIVICAKDKVKYVFTNLLILEKKTLIPKIWIISTSNTRALYAELAKIRLRRWKGKVVAITGSVGKTSVKEIARTVLKSHVPLMASSANENNDLGVCRTILGMDSGVKMLILEFGARKPGDIRFLANIARPDYAIVTNITASHLEFFGSLEKIAEEKQEIFCRFKDTSLAILNSKDPYFSILRKNIMPSQLLTLSEEFLPFVIVKNFGLQGYLLQFKKSLAMFNYALMGRHNLINLHFVLKLVEALKISEEEIIPGIEQISPFRMRMENVKKSEVTIINDCYNANPLSMSEGLQTLASLSWRYGRKIAVLGDMLELGKTSVAYHDNVGKIVANAGLKALYAVGVGGCRIAEVARQVSIQTSMFIFTFSELESLIVHLKQFVIRGDLIYLKSSRGLHLERILDHL